jgi:hypothetical protein
MKPGFHLLILKAKSSQRSGCTHIHQTRRKGLNRLICLPENWWQLLSGTEQERSADGGIHTASDHNITTNVLKKYKGPF